MKMCCPDFTAALLFLLFANSAALVDSSTGKIVYQFR